jgi:hypothetical protein
MMTQMLPDPGQTMNHAELHVGIDVLGKEEVHPWLTLTHNPCHRQLAEPLANLLPGRETSPIPLAIAT